MGILAFVFRMILRLGLWLMALVGVLAVVGVFVGIDMYRNHPGRLYDQLNWAALHRLPFSSDDERDDAFCTAAVNDLNRFAGMGSGTAYIVAAALNETGQCGQIEGGDAVLGLQTNRFTSGYLSDTEYLLRNKVSQLLHASGLYGDPAFWHRLNSLEYCNNRSIQEFAPAQFEAYLRNEELGYREARLAWHQYDYSCREQLYELAVEYVGDPS